ncbi:unnamed protein product [Thelazia callipaeda]|uniref:Uncharacterized protein n=1 Tax=Thelazia callipaeda TaxID=103827 RepID=A0A0N5D7U0_THECL|nr:unnamed protein product [Thelazia callipaeda]
MPGILKANESVVTTQSLTPSQAVSNSITKYATAKENSASKQFNVSNLKNRFEISEYAREGVKTAVPASLTTATNICMNHSRDTKSQRSTIEDKRGSQAVPIPRPRKFQTEMSVSDTSTVIIWIIFVFNKKLFGIILEFRKSLSQNIAMDSSLSPGSDSTPRTWIIKRHVGRSEMTPVSTDSNVETMGETRCEYVNIEDWVEANAKRVEANRTNRKGWQEENLTRIKSATMNNPWQSRMNAVKSSQSSHRPENYFICSRCQRTIRQDFLDSDQKSGVHQQKPSTQQPLQQIGSDSAKILETAQPSKSQKKELKRRSTQTNARILADQLSTARDFASDKFKETLKKFVQAIKEPQQPEKDCRQLQDRTTSMAREGTQQLAHVVHIPGKRMHQKLVHVKFTELNTYRIFIALSGIIGRKSAALFLHYFKQAK